jgi:uncharacterized membrane protein YgdD (TMEM256/DUF423 family)
LLSVATGAFGAHLLRDALEPARLASWETGSRYAAVHALMLVVLGLQGGSLSPAHRKAGLLFAMGILLFSGSLWGLALTGWRVLGPLTPLGGLSLMAGWLLVIVGALRAPVETS